MKKKSSRKRGASNRSCAEPAGSVGSWSYCRYRATLKKDGKAFAIVTPDGRNALSEPDVEILLRALNSEKELHSVLYDIDRKGGLQDWIARYDALFLEMCKARGVITASPNAPREPRGDNLP